MAILKKIIKIFFGKLFSGEQLTKNLVGNLFGVQPIRYLIGKFLYNIKYFFILKKNRDLDQFGYIVIENFLSENEFLKIREEYNSVIENKNFSLKYNDYGEGVEAHHVYLDENIKSKYPSLYNFYKNDKISDLFIKSELKNKINIIAKIERIKSKSNQYDDKVKTFHYDTYFNTFKAWFYLSDVSIDDGPLVFVQESHKFSFSRLFNEWITSVKYSLSKDKENWFGYGVDKKNVDYFNQIAKKMIFKKNTLIFANTLALHRRGEAKPGTIRETIHFYSRENPFKILF